MSAEKTLFTVVNLDRAFCSHYEAYRPPESRLDIDTLQSELTEEQFERLNQEINQFLAKESDYVEKLYICGVKDGIRLGKALKRLDIISGGPC